ncbi:hypothetical protein K493DRAFT_403642 [Basidiobolus meristosporus CBS 931.73]|uniref:Uncharacterized protein n=1 Tax=Basidiobolus meristosporus CBS 931.73 TaxID=1314790 RepID=A0A1Y1ZCP5_9FUNG|nr:hypothetical protein K493DRAFT_403642 [Basidiobolus meristosporus CBS 931.73]|eukprot:ORY07747.1 hypothetical protein K493DRAFT_403642 [Basidiobolus meristosporus CBS 931.73]
MKFFAVLGFTTLALAQTLFAQEAPITEGTEEVSAKSQFRDSSWYPGTWLGGYEGGLGGDYGSIPRYGPASRYGSRFGYVPRYGGSLGRGYLGGISTPRYRAWDDYDDGVGWDSDDSYVDYVPGPDNHIYVD